MSDRPIELQSRVVIMTALIAGKAETIFLILLLLSSAFTIPLALAIQSNELSQIYLPQAPDRQSSNGGGSYFFSSPVRESETHASLFEGQALIVPPSAPISSGENYFYAFEHGTYDIFPLDTFQNRASQSTFLAIVPLLLVWLDSERRRSRFRIYVEILDLLRKGPMTPYEIAFHLRLNSKRTKEYVEFLTKKKLIDCSNREGRLVSAITSSGLSFVENMKIILESNSMP